MGKLLLSIVAVILFALTVYFAWLVKLEATTGRPDGEVVLGNGARLIWQDCWFDTDENVDCARLHTSSKISDGEAAFVLPVVVFRYAGFGRMEDPVVFMAGGPGGELGLNEDGILDEWLPWYKTSRLKRDVVLFDQRGAGMSEPRLHCPEYYVAIRKQLTNDYRPVENARMMHKALAQCYEDFTSQGVNFEHVSTLHSANDVKDLMELLGYEQWNLKGESYSTRLAMVVEQIAKGKIRSMVLDSVYPLHKHFFREWPSLFDKAIQRIFDYCEYNESCKLEYVEPDLEARFWQVVEQLREDPMVFHLNDDEDMDIDWIIIKDETFIAMVFDAQYETGILPDLPQFIDAFLTGDLSTIRPYVMDYLKYRLDRSFSEMVFWAIECKDNPALKDKEVAELYETYPRIKPYLIKEYDNCNIWRKDQTASTDLKRYSNISHTPVMILAGQDDPVTPVDWADEVRNQYKKSEIFRFPDVYHIVIQNKDCGMELFLKFIRDPKKRPTADCRSGFFAKSLFSMQDGS